MASRVTPVLLVLFFSFPSFAQENPYQKDTETIESTITALYDVISGPKEKKRDWDRFNNLFLENARLVGSSYRQDSTFGYRSMSPEEYVASNGPFFETRDFYEVELARKMERYDNIVHIFSTYALTFEEGGKAAARGINSIQLLFYNNRWWVNSIFWEQESKEHPIPVNYLSGS